MRSEYEICRLKPQCETHQGFLDRLRGNVAIFLFLYHLQNLIVKTSHSLDTWVTVLLVYVMKGDDRIAQLTEHHCKKLVPASEVLHIAVIIYSITQSSMLRWSSEKLTATFTTFRPSSAKALA